MKFLLWEVTTEPYGLAKIQWVLFKIFGIKPDKPCGHTKSNRGYSCHQPLDLKHCNVINEGEIHKVVCKCCGTARMYSSCYINPHEEKSWIEF